jgi:hypothetical protein
MKFTPATDRSSDSVELDSVPGSTWAGTFRKLRFQLHASKQSFGKTRSQAEPGDECQSLAKHGNDAEPVPAYS